MKRDFHLATSKGIIKVEQGGLLKKLFCKHETTIEGEDCSSIGLMRISGTDRYVVCKKCGKILAEYHVNY